jgi:hypothetical protein
MNIRSIVLAGSLSSLLFASCGCSPQNGTRTQVDWENYDSSVRIRIDRLASVGDCKGLQAEFDIAERNNAAQRRRTGDGNDDLMGYIDQKMRESGCYK